MPAPTIITSNVIQKMTNVGVFLLAPIVMAMSMFIIIILCTYVLREDASEYRALLGYVGYLLLPLVVPAMILFYAWKTYKIFGGWKIEFHDDHFVRYFWRTPQSIQYNEIERIHRVGKEGHDFLFVVDCDGHYFVWHKFFWPIEEITDQIYFWTYPEVTARLRRHIDQGETVVLKEPRIFVSVLIGVLLIGALCLLFEVMLRIDENPDFTLTWWRAALFVFCAGVVVFGLSRFIKILAGSGVGLHTTGFVHPGNKTKRPTEYDRIESVDYNSNGLTIYFTALHDPINVSSSLANYESFVGLLMENTPHEKTRA